MKKNKTTNVRVLAQLGLLAAIEIVMKLIGLGLSLIHIWHAISS